MQILIKVLLRESPCFKPIVTLFAFEYFSTKAIDAMVNKYIDFITCKICPDTVVFQSLKRRPLFMGLYALEKFRNYGHRFTFLYNKLLINENDMKI